MAFSGSIWCSGDDSALEKARCDMRLVLSSNVFKDGSRAIYRTEVCAGAIYPNKVVSEPGYDKQWQNTILFFVEDIRRKTSREYTNYLLSAEDRYRSRGYDRGQEAKQKQVEIMKDRRDKVQAEYHVLELQPE
ncbi:hypothetical protein Tco_1556830, partial [Tanacetum coccineum]